MRGEGEGERREERRGKRSDSVLYTNQKINLRHEPIHLKGRKPPN
jgi:hypothetical protein